MAVSIFVHVRNTRRNRIGYRLWNGETADG